MGPDDITLTSHCALSPWPSVGDDVRGDRRETCHQTGSRVKSRKKFRMDEWRRLATAGCAAFGYSPCNAGFKDSESNPGCVFYAASNEEISYSEKHGRTRFLHSNRKTNSNPRATLSLKDGNHVSYCFGWRVCRFMGIGFLIGIAVAHTLSASAQEATAASVLELQQRVADLEATVQQLRKETRSRRRAIRPVRRRWPMRTPGSFPPLPPPRSTARQPHPSAVSPAGTTAFTCSPPINRSSCGSRGKSSRISADIFRTSTPPHSANPNVAGSPVTGSPDTFLIRRARLGIEATM